MALTRITKGVIKPNENYDTHNINSTGIVTSVGLDVNGNADISGSLSVGGVLTYEDVTSIDSVGIITAQKDIHVGAGVSAVGVGTFGSLDISGDIDVDGHTNLDNVSVAGVTTFNANVKFDGANAGRDITFTRSENALRFADQAIAKFGNSEDLKIFHDGSNSIIREVGTGGLYINTNLFRVTSSNATTPQYQNLIAADESGAVELYHSGTKRLETSSVGVSIPQDLDVDGHTNLDNVSIAGITTFNNSVQMLTDLGVSGDLDVNGHTNLDNVSIAGIITAQKDIHVGAGVSAVGVITGRYLNPSSVSTQNVIIGYESSARNVTGSWNVLLGRRAGESLTSASSAVCIGANAGQLLGSTSGIFIGGQAGSKVTGSGNIFMGPNAGQQTTSATSCVIIGTYAGIDNQGSENTIVGYYAGRGNSGVTDGTRNTFIGTKSGFKIQGGDDNTGLGRNSLVELLGGNKNVAIGQQAGDALVSGNNNIIIGYRADASTSTTSNEITLGDANINHLRIPGIGVSFNSTGGTQLGIVTATSFSGDGSNITNLNASNIASGTVPTARLGSGTASSSTFLRGDSTFQTVNTDLVSDSSPQLGGTLDGNGNTANFTANNTGLGIPIGTDGNEPSAGSYKGYIRFNDDDDIIYYSDGTNWKKISAEIVILTSITGSIYVGTATNLTLSGTGFLSANLVVNFVQSSDGINANVTVTPSNDSEATVAVPAAVYNNVNAGRSVTIKVTNSDNSTSGTINKTALALPSGGNIYTSGGYRYHKFTSSGTFTQTLSKTVEYLIVAGGGAGGGGNSGGNRLGGGGGAGGLRGGSVSTTPQGYSITIGAGGSGVSGSEQSNGGSNSSAFGITSTGGGGGGSGDSTSPGYNGGNGGSGGGGGRSGSGGSGTSGQGNDGGNHNSTTNPRVQGGGGGAGAAGNNGSNNGSSGNGYGGVGSNAYSTWASATSSGDSGYYAGGGGGGWHGSYTPATRALGGAGGGGNGGDSTGDNSNAYGKTGDANTGGGGGGNSTTAPHNAVSGAPNGPAGGSGIVIIRYQL